jgi:hypothetical protein
MMRVVYEYWMACKTRPWSKFGEQAYGQCFALAMISPLDFEGWRFAVRQICLPMEGVQNGAN